MGLNATRKMRGDEVSPWNTPLLILNVSVLHFSLTYMYADSFEYKLTCDIIYNLPRRSTVCHHILCETEPKAFSRSRNVMASSEPCWMAFCIIAVTVKIVRHTWLFPWMFWGLIDRFSGVDHEYERNITILFALHELNINEKLRLHPSSLMKSIYTVLLWTHWQTAHAPYCIQLRARGLSRLTRTWLPFALC